MSWRNLAAIAFVLPLAAAARPAPPAPVLQPDGGTVVTVKVGNDGACDFANITQAMFAPTANLLVILVAKNNVMTTTQTILGRNVQLVGGYNTCSSTTPSGHTVLSGSAFTGSVLRTNASFAGSGSYGVTISALTISNGTGSSSFPGGGMTIDGPFQVSLSDTYVQFNTGSLGGGIFVRGEEITAAGTEAVTGGERTALMLEGNSIVSNNTAVVGGGIACTGRVTLISQDTQIAVNTATSTGGGISSDHCNVYLYEHGPLQGVLSNSVTSASGDGGGIDATSGILIVAGSATKQSVIDSNSAAYGGGISKIGGFLSVSDATVTNNTAAIQGGGIYAIDATTSVTRTLPGGNCHHALRCSELSGNHVTGTGSNAKGGALYTRFGKNEISGTFIENNQVAAGRGMAVYAENSFGTNGGADLNGLRIFGSVIATSGTGGPAVGSDSSIVHLQDSAAALGFNTFSRNVEVPRIVYTPTTAGGTLYPIRIYGTIFDHTSGVAASPGTNGTVPMGDCNLLREISSPFGSGSARSTTIPAQFVNAAAGDYGLLSGSLLLDWCDVSYSYSTAYTAEGGIRPYDDPSIGQLYGNYDLGALERQPADLIFRNGFN